VSDGGAPPANAAGGDGKSKLTSLGSAAGLPKHDPDAEPDAVVDPGKQSVWEHWVEDQLCARLASCCGVPRGCSCCVTAAAAPSTAAPRVSSAEYCGTERVMEKAVKWHPSSAQTLVTLIVTAAVVSDPSVQAM